MTATVEDCQRAILMTQTPALQAITPICIPRPMIMIPAVDLYTKPALKRLRIPAEAQAPKR